VDTRRVSASFCQWWLRYAKVSLRIDVFERRTATGSCPFSLFICLNATIFVWLSVFTLIETICPQICSKSPLKSAKSPLPVDVRRSKTSLPKLPDALWLFGSDPNSLPDVKMTCCRCCRSAVKWQGCHSRSLPKFAAKAATLVVRSRLPSSCRYQFYQM